MRDFLERYPCVAEALFLGEELGGLKKQQRFHAKAEQQHKGRDVRRGDIWNNAGEHSIAVGMLAEILAKKMCLPEESVKRVAMAGGLHDWWKKHEIMRMWDAEDRLNAGHYDLTAKETMNNPAVIAEVSEAFDVAKIEDQHGLHVIGIPEEVIQLTGVSRMRTKEGPQTDEELILYFVDFMMAGVRPMDMMTRIHGAVKSNPLYTAYENSFKNDLGGKTMHELLMGGMGHQILHRVAERIGFKGDVETLHVYIGQLFIDAIDDATM
jgi:hypothetical protein